MQPVYFKKANPRDRKTWIDRFVSREPKGGFRDVVERVQKVRSRGI